MRFSCFACVFTFLFGLVVGLGSMASAQCVLDDEQRLGFTGLGIFDFAGQATAIDGNVIAVGAPLHQGPGAVFVFRRNAVRWVLEQKLFASDALFGAEFGRSVSICGNVLAVGAHADDAVAPGAGAVYIFRYQSGTWVEEQKLVAADASPTQSFGIAVSMDGDELAVGAIRDDQRAVDAGAVYVFSYTGTTWQQDQKLTASDAKFETQFGASLSLDAGRLMIGAYLRDSSGAVYSFVPQGNRWVEDQKILASDAAFGDLFGAAVSVSGNWMVVGAQLEDANGAEAGAGYFFQWNGQRWVERQKVVASDGTATDFFGCAADMDGDRAVIGSYGNSAYGHSSGAAYLYRRSGGTWIQQQKLLPSDGGSAAFFGASTAISGGNIVGGAYFVFPGGAAYVFSAPEFGLMINPDTVRLDDFVRVWSCGGVAGSPVVTFISAMDSTPIFQQLPLAATFDSAGVFTTTTRVRKVPSHLPVDLEFTAFTIDSNGALLQSNSDVITIR